MLEKPDLEDERLKATLVDGYGLRVTDLTFLPLGADVNTAVYRANAEDGRAYFVKLRRGTPDEMSVAVPACLGEQGIEHIIAPIRTTTGRLWGRLEPFTVILYPFVAGADGYEMTLSVSQWVELGAALARIHMASLPDALKRGLPRESYSAQWREQARTFQSQLRATTYDDPVAAELAETMRARAAMVTQLVEAAEQLGQAVQGRALEEILCHGDLHAGNLLLGQDGALYIVDWDTAVLAPKERDLMFVGSGLGPGWDQPQATAWFYQGYGPTTIDAVALAYYRCERIVQDIVEFCKQVLATRGDSQDRRQALRYLTSQFRPNGVVEIALQSYAAALPATRK